MGAPVESGQLEDLSATRDRKAGLFVGAGLEHRFIEIDAGITYFKLGEMHPNSYSSRACLYVITHEHPLTASIKMTVGFECKRTCWNCGASADKLKNFGSHWE